MPHNPIRRQKTLLGKFGQHSLFDPGMVAAPNDAGSDDDENDVHSENTNGGLSPRPTGNMPLHSANRVTSLNLDIFEAEERTRLGQNYYKDEDKIKLWKNQLYIPPSAAGKRGLKKIVDREYNLKIWCYELANDTNSIRMVNYHLKSVPPPLCDMTHLTSINLSENRLKELPPEIGRLVHLRELDLSFNELESLPEEIGQEVERDPVSGSVFISQFAQGGLLMLEKLNVSNNKIVAIPQTFARLENLNEFEFNNNLIEVLPAGFSRWRMVTSFSPHQNRISTVPHELCSIVSLTELNVSNNRVMDLPQAIGKLKNLVRLDCSFNRLCQLPASVCELDKLEVLLLIDNNLELLPSQLGGMKSLRELNLYHNLLEDLPESMKLLDNVEIVDLDYNPLSQVPALIRDEGWVSIRAFLSSDLLTRRKIKLRDHTQTVGQGVMGKDVPKFVEVRIQLEAKKRLEKKLAKGRSFDHHEFEQAKAKEIMAVQVRTPKVDESAWLLFEGEDHRGHKQSVRKARQTELNKALFEDIAEDVLEEAESYDMSESGSGSESSGDEFGEEEEDPEAKKETLAKSAISGFGFAMLSKKGGGSVPGMPRKSKRKSTRKSIRSANNSVVSPGSTEGSGGENSSVGSSSTTSTRRRRNQRVVSIHQKKKEN
ncbi:hypothetical protein TrST_g2462 [Triparma strigata]|uniref:Disease resistance R13L4/SHOC-2-like LRR domain-containing protein n=1 Tax=Triparma strigata TaxID=1606541 RepID=A0A9W7BWB2_9STRA|nr:hypothetical protein TrST_g2462 [Triparma strigata]